MKCKSKYLILFLLVLFASSFLLNILLLSKSSNWISKCTGNNIIVPPQRKPATSTSLDAEATDCSELLNKFRADKVDIVNSKRGGLKFRKSYVALNSWIINENPKSFYISTHDEIIDNVRSSIMKNKEYYETELSRLVANTFERKRRGGKDMIFLDVGSNIGWFSLVALAHGASAVYAFEPNLQNTIRFCESLSLNGWLRDGSIFPITKGVGNTEKEMKLYESSSKNPGSYSFAFASNRDGHVADVVDTVHITTLDAFAHRHGWFDSKPEIFFKLDVENFEREVIEGAEKTLKSGMIKSISMELKHTHSEESKTKILKIIYESGYHLVLHGGYEGPNKKVQQSYSNWKDLVSDFQAKKYGENVFFRLKNE